uniref:RING-type domain-containing protein n=1 Tax=Pygocentrus nattereri TaxID=42514 RepID=A0A3B4DB31_PYGNA
VSGMDMFWRIIAALSFGCCRNTPSSSQRSSKKLGSSQAASMESSSLTGSLSLASDVPHCQCCISYEARLRRLSCGHLYCDPCTDQIVNLAFEDIEGLAEYPCPMCKSLRQLGGLHGYPIANFAPYCSPFGSQKQRLVEEKGGQWD